MGQPATGNEFEVGAADTVAVETTETVPVAPVAQTPDTPGQDENKDGLTGGQATADVTGDILGV